MKSLDRILFAHDLTPVGVDAWEEVRALARTFGSRVLFLHAIPEGSEFSAEFDVVASQAQSMLSDLREQGANEGVDIAEHNCIESGDPVEVVLSQSEVFDPSLVALGSSSKGTLDRLLLGSSAEKIIRRSKRPVWLIRPGHAHTEFERLLCAVSESGPSYDALATAIFLARTFVARLTLLTVADKDAPAAKTRLRLWVEDKFDLHGIDVHFEARAGDVATEVVEAVMGDDTDVLILGSAGRTGLARLLHANTAEKLARLAPCSILVVPSPHGEDITHM